MSSPTIYDIAARAGVGIATVSRVINGSRRVSDKTRKSVQKAMGELDFRPNNAARRLAAGAPNRARVVALMPFFTTSFYFTVCKTLSQKLSSENTDLVLVDVKNQEEADRHLDRLLAERSCEGVILCSMDINEERRDQYDILNIPLVALDHQTEIIPHIRVDNVEGGRLLSRALSDRGADKQALIIGTRSSVVFRDREAGFCEACPEGSRVIETELTDHASGAEVTKQLLESFPELNGIACAGDQLAVGALQELRRQGVSVPDQVQVIGFDDQPLMDVLGLTTVRQPMEKFGDWAADRILELIKNPTERPESLVVPLELIDRATTKTA
ncbi:MAG: LacI family transcriptional regulator [Polyangiaceae bacterium]|nr:LacI family transcriptional regulator [Polyangiaceae bacterium]